MRAHRFRARAFGGDAGGAATPTLNDYPTAARADYVFACMKINGETREALEQCSCSIDVIASLLPYDAYVAGETVASMDQDNGQIGRAFNATKLAKEELATLRRAQAEAEVRCFDQEPLRASGQAAWKCALSMSLASTRKVLASLRAKSKRKFGSSEIEIPPSTEKISSPP